MELVSTMEISGEEREIADAYAREQCTANSEVIDSINSNLDTLEYGEVAGGKNLFDRPIGMSNATFSNGTMICNTPTNVRGGFLAISLLENGTEENTIISAKYTSGHYYGSCPITTNTKKVRIVFSGDKVNANLYFDVSKFEEGTYYLSFDLEYSYTNCIARNIQFEKGTTSTPYKPYIPSVKMLAEEVNAQNESLSVVGKCKNLLNPSHLGTTVMGITCTNNGDGTYALNGTATADLDLCIKGFKNLQLNKEYKMLGCPSGGSDSTYMLHDSSESDIKDIGKGKVYTPTKQPNINIRIMNGVTVNNLVFKPMLTANLSATYDDFVPYTGDGETLTADVAELKNDLSDSLPVGTILTVEADTPMSSDMWRFLNTGKMTYQNGGALVEMGTMIYQKIK